MFSEISRVWQPKSGLYLGSYLDISPSTALSSVTYVDIDRRADQYFGDMESVRLELRGRTEPGAGRDISYVHADYSLPIPNFDGAFDLLISLYAGPTWPLCLRYLRPGGLFLANASHGDASLAALDSRLELVGALSHTDDAYLLDRESLGSYLVAKSPKKADTETILSTGKGIAYTKSAFAYVFALNEDAQADE